MYLDLQFCSVMQSWGIKEEWINRRRTAACPGKTAVAGIIGRAMGIDRDDEEGQEMLRRGIKDIIVKKCPVHERMSDDETIYIGDYVSMEIARGFPAAKGGVRNVGGIVLSQTFNKDYLIDSLSDPVVVAISGSQEFLEKVRHALLHPVYPVYFGRYCCIPARTVLVNGEIYETLCV